MSDAANQSPRKISATAETRCAHQCSAPCLAEPKPIARPSGVRSDWRAMASAPHRHAGGKGHDCEHEAPRHHRPPRSVGGAQIEAHPGVPEEMANAVQEMKEEGERPAKQQEKAEPG